MFKCQITFSKVFLSLSNESFYSVALNAATFFSTMLFCYTILCLKLDIPWGNKKTFTCFINFLHKFTKMPHKTKKKFSTWQAILLAKLRIFCESIFVSKFRACDIRLVNHEGQSVNKPLLGQNQLNNWST